MKIEVSVFCGKPANVHRAFTMHMSPFPVAAIFPLSPACTRAFHTCVPISVCLSDSGCIFLLDMCAYFCVYVSVSLPDSNVI